MDGRMIANMNTPPALRPEVLVPRLGDHLLEKGLISAASLQKALFLQEEKRSQGKPALLGEVLVDMGVIDRISLDEAVTEQIMQLRSALQESNRQLERRVEERTIELQNALKKLSELNQLKSNIVANISHELRTPLTHIKGYVELMITQGLGPLTEPQMTALQVMQRSTQRLERQIEDLIHFSLAARGELTLQLVPVNLVKLFETIDNRSTPKAAERNIAFTTSCPPDLPSVKADDEKISWAISQLIDNAIKFTPPDGKVDLSAKVDHEQVVITITDTGIGIPGDRLEEIFEPFHQLDGSATRRFGGTGLGLALVRQIIEAHGSVVRVNSAVGKGSRFEFVLNPADEGEAIEPPVEER